MQPFDVKRILCPVDFSAESIAAARCAGTVAQKFGAELVLFHAVEPLPYPVEFGPLPALVADAEPSLLKQTRDQLESVQRSNLAQVAGVRCISELGIPEHAICEVAKREGADLIVLSTHGRSGLSHLLLGSVAERVLRFAPCPVLTVKSPPK